MATHDIFMPALSSTMTEGKIVDWLKQPGEQVSRGESVLVVESDKADMDVESFHDGYLAAVLMPTGSTAPVGETIGLIVETEEEIAAVQSQAPSTAVSPPPSTSQQIESEKEPITTKSEPVTPAQSAPPLQTSEIRQEVAAVAKKSGRVVASPRAKKLASTLGVDLTTVQGTGPHGRIQADDVQAAKGQPVTVPWIAESNAPVTLPASQDRVPQKTSNQTKPAKNLTGNAFGSPGQTIAFNTLQQAVNRNMEASITVPCFRVGYTITTDLMEDFYREIKPKGVTMTALLAKAVGVTLSRHPQVNAACSSEGISYPNAVNVAIAVAMEDGGLITPVLKDADKTELLVLSQQWADLVKRSRSKQLQPDEYNSGTFTLSNLGMFGVDRFDAILPPGTGAILAVAASQSKVVAGKDGSIAVRRQMQVNLTADHRVIYGADGAAFLRDLADLLETKPESLAE